MELRHGDIVRLLAGGFFAPKHVAGYRRQGGIAVSLQIHRPDVDVQWSTVMKLFRKIDDHCEPPGLERVILKKLPMYLAGGTAVPALMAAFSRMFPPTGTLIEIAKQIGIIDYLALGAVISIWTAALTVAIGCLVVIVMKGPAYAADSYYMEDPDHPDRNQRHDSSAD